MARPLDGAVPPGGSASQAGAPQPGRGAPRLDRAAARAFAAAISSLVIATLVVTQSAEALDPKGTVTGNAVEAGTVSLSDDDAGRSLLELTDMAPSRPVERCIAVRYDGSVVPADVSLAATSSGTLAPYLQVVVELGGGAAFGDCARFVPRGTVFSGTVADLVAAGPLPVAVARNSGDALGFRFRFELVDDGRAMGQAAAVDLVWEAVPS
ncbi:MAG: hypothetical protein IT196_27560 [Acidimicrobiales bacterium]|nr:hypothetical protein [Acidimicrobiales bacterium]